MDVWRITLAALRRWYVLFPLLALAGYATISVGDSVKPEYEATATIMYIAGPGETELPNPYGSLTGANEVVGIVLNSVETHNELVIAGNAGLYEVAPQSRTSITSISIRSTDLEQTIDTGTAVVDAARQELLDRQTAAGIPDTAQVKLDVLEAPTVIAAVQDGKTRIQAIVGLVGASVALLAAVLFDDIVGLVKRARGRSRRGESAVAAHDPELSTSEPGAPGAPGELPALRQLPDPGDQQHHGDHGDAPDDEVEHWTRRGDRPVIEVRRKRRNGVTRPADDTTDVTTDDGHLENGADEAPAASAAPEAAPNR